MVFVIHWRESAMDLHVFPIRIPPPTSLSTRSLWVFLVHQARALVSCIQPGLVIYFTLDNIHVSMLFIFFKDTILLDISSPTSVPVFRAFDFPLCWFTVCVLKSLRSCPSLRLWTVACKACLSMQGLQARTLKWIAMPSSRGSSWPRDRTCVSLCLLHWQGDCLLLTPPCKSLLVQNEVTVFNFS